MSEPAAEFVDDADLLADLGVAPAPEEDITVLKHVRSRDEVRAAEEIANRAPCEDFDRFKPLFDGMQAELASGLRETREFGRDPSVAAGDFFILGGQVVYVAEIGEAIKAPNGESDARLRAIFANGTESNLLRRSLQRALYKDETGRRVTAPSAGPLFGNASQEDDLESGTIYVLRSKSDHPEVAAHRDLIHKIGVTGGEVEARIAQAATDATYLLAEVEIVATYKLFNINRTKLENLLHRIFAPARLDLTIQDRFGRPVQPREWYLKAEAIAISMDGKGCWRDNVFPGSSPRTSRLWKSVKYEEVYLHAYDSVSQARAGIGRYLEFYNARRPHTAHGGRTPDQAYASALPIAARAA